MTNLRPLFWIVLLLGLPLAPAIAAPPIRCVHQTTVVKNGKATTHLILTTARPGEARTAKNTVDVTRPCSIMCWPNSEPTDDVSNIIANKDYTIAVVHFSDRDLLPEADHCPIYLFLSTAKGLKVLPNFYDRICRFMAATPVRHNDGSRWPLYFWSPRQLSVTEITGRTLEIRIGTAEITEGWFEVSVTENGNFKILGYEEEGE